MPFDLSLAWVADDCECSEPRPTTIRLARVVPLVELLLAASIATAVTALGLPTVEDQRRLVQWFGL